MVLSELVLFRTESQWGAPGYFLKRRCGEQWGQASCRQLELCCSTRLAVLDILWAHSS